MLEFCHPTKMKVALEDLNLDPIKVIYLGIRRYGLTDKIRVVLLFELKNEPL